MDGESAAVAYTSHILPRAYRKSRHGDRSMPKGTAFLHVKDNVYKGIWENLYIVLRKQAVSDSMLGTHCGRKSGKDRTTKDLAG